MAKLISNRYALSLFETGIELDKVEDFHNELNFINQVFQSEEKLFDILRHPKISKNEKKSLIEEIFKGKLSQETINFFYIIIDKRRERYIYEIVEEFNKKYNEYMNIVNVIAITAIPMEDKAQDRLKQALETKLNKNIKFFNKVDKSIIGGVLLKMDNKFVDATLASQLKDMETALKGVSL